MKRKEYSAGMVKLSFWFAEFRKVIQLLNSGKTLLKIKKMNVEENIFSAPTQARAIQIFNTISTRVKSLDQSFYKLFERSDISNQKVIVLIAIMQSDSLFFDFVYEVYREKVILGIPYMEDSDLGIFFKNKEAQSDDVATWKDTTVKHLKSNYLNYLADANLLSESTKKYSITPPIVDVALERYLQAREETAILKAITGVR